MKIGLTAMKDVLEESLEIERQKSNFSLHEVPESDAKNDADTYTRKCVNKMLELGFIKAHRNYDENCLIIVSMCLDKSKFKHHINTLASISVSISDSTLSNAFEIKYPEAGKIDISQTKKKLKDTDEYMRFTIYKDKDTAANLWYLKRNLD